MQLSEQIGNCREMISSDWTKIHITGTKKALRLQVETSLGRRPDRDWVRSSGRPRPELRTQSTNSARTIGAHLLTYGEQPSSVVTLERRYGPRRLRDDDDDDPSFRMAPVSMTLSDR